MDSNLLNPTIHKQEEILASGDACCTDKLMLSPSLTDLLPHPITDLDLSKDKNAEIWRYGARSAENESRKSKQEYEAVSPKFISMGSLRKTQYQDHSKRQRKIISRKSIKREDKILNQNNKNPKGSHSNSCFTSRENLPALNFLKMVKLFSCQVCQTSPMTTTTVHMCKHSHQACGNCSNKNQQFCKICEKPLEGRNKLIETALQKLRLIHPEMFFQEFPAPSNTNSFEESYTKATNHSSHKPVKCPHQLCQKTVAYNGFLSHFKFDHCTVPVVATDLDLSHEFSLPESLLHDSITRAVTVFKVNLTNRKNPEKVSEDGDPHICCLLTFPLKVGCVESLGVWCSSLSDSSSSSLIYNLKSPNSRRLMAYRGPVASLHESTVCILKEGRCLVIGPEMLKSSPLQNESSNLFHVEFYCNS